VELGALLKLLGQYSINDIDIDLLLKAEDDVDLAAADSDADGDDDADDLEKSDAQQRAG
jgi:hypothetical protein